MVRTVAVPLVLLLGFCSAACAPIEGTEEEVMPDGRTVFQERNCALCHTVLAGEPAPGPDAASDNDEGKAKLSDLSSVGSTLTAEGFRLFLVEGEEIDGRGHVTLFDGSEGEWSVLSDWLLGFAAPPDTSEAEPGHGGPDGGGTTDTLRITRPPEQSSEAASDGGSE